MQAGHHQRQGAVISVLQIVNGLSPPYLRCLLPQRVSKRTRYVLRTSNHLSTPASRTNMFSRSFVPSTVVEWNKLEDHIKYIPTLASFKNRLMPKKPTNKYAFLLWSSLSEHTIGTTENWMQQSEFAPLSYFACGQSSTLCMWLH